MTQLNNKLFSTNIDVSEKVQYIHISDGATGYSYVSLFNSCLDGNIEWVEIQDPYIRAKHQVIQSHLSHPIICHHNFTALIPRFYF